jgi:hypothetical protein
LPASLALSPTPPTALRTASTPEPLLDEPLRDFDALAPLLELRDFELVAFALELFDLADLGFDDFDLVDDFARFGVDRFFWD